jgi:hypothetical protein
MAKAWLKLQAANDRAAPNSRQAGKKDKAEQRRKESQRNRDYQTGAYTSEMDNTIDVGDRQGSYLNCGYPFGPTNIPEEPREGDPRATKKCTSTIGREQ